MTVDKNFFSSLSLYVSRLLSMIFGLLVNIYLAKTLTVENFGVYSVSLNLVYIFLVFSEWGQNLVGTRQIASLSDPIEKNRVLSEILSFKIIITIIIVIVYFVIVYFFYNDYWMALTIPILQLLITPFILDWYFQAENQLFLIAFRQSLIAFFTLVFSYLFINQSDQTLLSIFIYNVMIVLGTIVVLGLFMKKSYRIEFAFRKADFINRLKSSGLYFFSAIIITLSYSLGLIILGVLNLPVQAAIYSTYYRIFSSLVAPAIITYNIFLPLLVKEYTLKNNRKYLFILINTALFIIYVSFFIGPDVYRLLYPSKYSFDPTVFSLFLILIFVHFINYYYVYSLLIKHNDFYFFISVSISLLMNIIMIIYLYETRSLNAFSIVVSLLVAETTNFIVSLFLLNRIASQTHFSLILRSLFVFSIPMIILYFLQRHLVSHFNFLGLFIGCSFIYASILFRTYLKSFNLEK